MTHTTGSSSASFRFLLLGGWTAVKSAFVGSLFAVLVALAVSGISAVWQNGPRALEFSGPGLESLLSSVAFLLLVAILLSIFPAFIGGVLLAWFLQRENSISSVLSLGKTNPGAWIGASAGAVLTLLVLIPADFVGRHAHGGLGYSLLESMPRYVFFALEFIAIATSAGIWTDHQLRTALKNATPGDAG